MTRTSKEVSTSFAIRAPIAVRARLRASARAPEPPIPPARLRLPKKQIGSPASAFAFGAAVRIHFRAMLPRVAFAAAFVLCGRFCAAEDMARRAVQVLQSECGGCHGGNAAMSG